MEEIPSSSLPLDHAHRLCDLHDHAAIDARLAHVRVEGVEVILNKRRPGDVLFHNSLIRCSVTTSNSIILEPIAKVSIQRKLRAHKAQQ